MSWTVEFYEDASGRSPVQEFLGSLTKKQRAKVMRNMGLLEKFGVHLGMPYARQLTGYSKLWELRVDAGTNDHRVFYFAFTGRRFVMLHAIRKQTRKTPSQDLRTAMARMNEYLSRKEDE
ncbi:MAG: hypothetical protein AUJ92_10385 [Armatimonadetes bacterium CG2_30_59_28]|nr:type II toxin-antitoxin system RelE/ParE family toxin [Armatimonadota bacterium]OIO94301.1 MAG: hypothetical protein AUJ92_10385 [Armatimonadetes bacterium CG2_30_59_28]PIU64884.1 MAG: type II toxin-antitoxin system RelE/ParE family toxin [Armatimonadetes bacterium CG07_land_8_20_14_0_80_59_28]PIX42120.1 MAG: type II toxin-antitoxin system RelE/ParE family toxin [Armatimonadetes bacterium CG_4_8_14_3_um_filter_58_9]PIY47141.1 MAG: type II toxin-antitoxin system RelE/ParE family toxin [Armati